MKYKLKRDLPIGEKGTIVDRVVSRHGTKDQSYIKIGSYSCFFSDFVNIFDWVEEVKPREFTLSFNAGGIEVMLLDRGALPYEGGEVIKVREIMDDCADSDIGGCFSNAAVTVEEGLRPIYTCTTLGGDRIGVGILADTANDAAELYVEKMCLSGGFVMVETEINTFLYSVVHSKSVALLSSFLK